MALGVVAFAALASGCGGDHGGSAQASRAGAGAARADTSLESAAIQQLENRWQHGIYTGDTAVVTALFEENASYFPPRGPMVSGRSEILQAYQAMYHMPGVQFTFEQRERHFDPGARMAYELGTWRSRGESARGTIKDGGRYLLVWEKQEDRWRVAAQVLHSEKD